MKTITLVSWTGGNYGTALQAYAMCCVLRKYSNNLHVISSFPKTYNIKLLKGIIKQKIACTPLYKKMRGIRIPLRHEKYSRFIRKNIPIVTLFSRKQFERIINNTDIFISGSDQIWNTYHKYDPNFFLSFVKNKRRIAYSSSIGTRIINPRYSNEVRQHLLQFEKIGVREKSAVTALSELTGRIDIEKVLDPVFLLSPNEWRNISPTISLPKSKYMLCYCVGNNDYYHNQIKEVAMAYGMDDIYVIPSFEHEDFFSANSHLKILKEVAPQDFVHLINNAEVVCTDSFHATAFSICFNKNFVELKRFDDSDDKSQNSRIYDLLNSFSLSQRLFGDGTIEWKLPIDYKTINELVEKQVADSYKFLDSVFER